MNNLDFQFSDLDLYFLPHPVSKDIGILTGVDAVRRSVKNLVLTKNYERPFHPELGCQATQLLFENMTEITAITLKSSIEEVINNFEPRARLISVDVKMYPDENGYMATVNFYVENYTELVSIDFFLERLR